ncbi:MAG: diaminopimelate epimerase [Ulvibacter sp.]
MAICTKYKNWYDINIYNVETLHLKDNIKMLQIDYIKMSGAGNSFTIVDARDEKYEFSRKQIREISQEEKTKCDQFIVIRSSFKANCAIEIFNNDGSRVGACGNASRCIAYLMIQESISEEVSIETDYDILECRRRDDKIEVNMGIPRFNWRQIPLKKEIKSHKFRIKHPIIENWEFGAVNIGNPHLVTFIDHDIEDDIFFEVGPFLENHPLFPEKINVEFANIIGPNHIKVRVWERGVGETQACGSGACAVAAMAIKKSLVDESKKITVSFLGGDIYIKSNVTKSLNMIGDYKYIANGQLNLNNVRNS